MNICPRCKERERLGKKAYCRLCNNAYARDYNKQRAQQNRERTRRWLRKLRREVLAKLGNKCVHCGNTDHRVLQVDHVDGGGRKEEKKIGTQGIYRKIGKGHTKGYQLLCSNCNWIKRHEQNEVPYQT